MPAVSQPQQVESMDSQNGQSMSSHSRESGLSQLVSGRKAASLPSRERVSAAIALVRAKQAAVSGGSAPTKVSGIDELKKLKKARKHSESAQKPVHPTISMTSTLTSTSSMRKPYHIMGAPAGLKTSVSAISSSSHPAPPTPTRQPFSPVDHTEPRKETASPADETGKMSFIQNVFASRSEVKGVTSSSTLPNTPSMPDDDESSPRENEPSSTPSAAAKLENQKPMVAGDATDVSSVSSFETDSEIGGVDPKMMKDIGQFLDKLHVKEAPAPLTTPPTAPSAQEPAIAMTRSEFSEEDPVEALRQLSSDFVSSDSSDSDDSEISSAEGVNQETLAEIGAFIDAIANPGTAPVPQAAKAKISEVEEKQKQVDAILTALDKQTVKTDAPTLADPIVSSPVHEKQVETNDSVDSLAGPSSSTESGAYDNTAEQLRTTKPSPIYEQLEALARGANRDPPAMNPDQFALNREDPPAPTDLSEAVIRLREADVAVAPSYSAESLEAGPIIDAISQEKLGLDPMPEEKKETGFDSDDEQDAFERAARGGHSLDFYEDDYDAQSYMPGIGKSLSPVFETPSGEGDDQSVSSVGVNVKEDTGNDMDDRIEERRNRYDDCEDETEIEVEALASTSDYEIDEEQLLSDGDMVDYEELLLEALGTATSSITSPKQSASVENDEPEKLDTEMERGTADDKENADTDHDLDTIEVSATESTEGEDNPDDAKQVPDLQEGSSHTSCESDMDADSRSEMERYECLEQDDASNMGTSAAGASDIDSRQLSDIDEIDDLGKEEAKLEVLPEATSSNDDSSDEEADAQKDDTSPDSSPETGGKEPTEDSAEGLELAQQESDKDETLSEMGTRIKMGDLPHSPSMKGAVDTDNDSVPWELRDIASEETMKAAGRTRPRAVFTGQRRARVIKSLLSDDSSAVHSQVYPIESSDPAGEVDGFVPPEAKLGISDVVVFDEGDDIEVLETSTYLAGPVDEKEDGSRKDYESEAEQDELPVPAPSGIGGDDDYDSTEANSNKADSEVEDNETLAPAPSGAGGDSDATGKMTGSADPSGRLGRTLEQGGTSQHRPDPDASVVEGPEGPQESQCTDPKEEAAEDCEDSVEEGALIGDGDAGDGQDFVQAFLQSGSMDEGDTVIKSPEVAREEVEVTQEALDSVLQDDAPFASTSNEGGRGNRHASALRVNTSTSVADMLEAPDVLSPSAIARFFVSLDDGDFSAERAEKVRHFQNLIAPVISGQKPSIIEVAQIRQAAKKARISLETVDKFLDFAEGEQPPIPQVVSSADDDFAISKWDNEMEDLNEDEAIGAFLSRHGVPKAIPEDPVEESVEQTMEERNLGASKAVAEEPVEESVEHTVEERDLYLPSGIARYFASLDRRSCSEGQAKKIRHFQKLIAPVSSGEKPSIMQAAQIRQAAQKAKISLDVVDRFLEFAEYADDAQQPAIPEETPSAEDDFIMSKWDDEMEDLNEDEAIGAFLSRHEALKARAEKSVEKPPVAEPAEEPLVEEEAAQEEGAEEDAEDEELDLLSPVAIARYFVSLDDINCSEGRAKKVRYFQKLVAPVISGVKPSIIEAAQIRQAAQKARVPLDVVDRFLEFVDDEQPAIPANVSSADEAACAWDNEMDDLNEDDAIGAFLARFGALKAGGHIIGNGSEVSDADANNNECKDEEVEVDVEVGYVNKNLHGDDEEEEWWKGMSHLERKAAARRAALTSPTSDMNECEAGEDDEDNEDDEAEDESSASSRSEIDSHPESKKERPPSAKQNKNFFPDDVDDIDMASASFAYDTRTENAIWNRKKAIATHGGWEKHSSWLSPRNKRQVHNPLPIDGVAAAEGLGRFMFSKRLLLAVRRPWKLPYKERTKNHPGFFNVDIHSVYDSSAVHLVSGEVGVTPWEHREVQQRFLHERSVTFSRNWFGELPRVRGNPKYKPPFCKPKSMEMPIENIPDPGEWTEEWYTVWKSPYERRRRKNDASGSYDTDSASDDDGSYTDRGSHTNRGSFDVSRGQQKSMTSNDESDYSGSSDENESDDDASWEEAPECGILINVKQKIGERVSRVHPDYTSSLRRSRWRKKYFPRGAFPYK
mmetsp:Transcript_21610/g.33017  ORF Transcript_21610/g.33017 Transcript_21610/m.33017 type:complete len:2075 (+) Transcript_21610:97-6321(+)|eukprot:CAMPEP_0117036312 /NCGR_PEP_ID=MMETSP0472-20121206/25729_1 /TAXON_ID=693140 ORGANISM="Tiarina fusus, Strain LIS" /NCGR_SAMPLE_ID=MMETSP0472 /ASSEMBLY_ACC=CAM_ASM_000603 /LENGTH=2074 /DNA_ID=CAMNT_0004746029 /DNA_START=97 /DNA_END=6321 /DNA_ORIENTATION=+